MNECDILVVDDEDFMRGAIIETLRRGGYSAMTASGAHEAIDLMTHRGFSLVLTDVKMPGMDGLTLFRKIKELRPETSVVIMTGFPNLQDAINVIKEGAVDYLQKPFPPDKLIDIVEQFIDVRKPKKETDFANIITDDAYMLQILEKIRMVAPSNAPVLIQGETGTGKELIAQALHNNSRRHETGELVALNCAAIPGSLLESEMFGAEKGSYTGANALHIGRFERAHKGTLFLDEISELSWELQAKLLRALQEREIERVGASQPTQVNVRVIASTNENIEKLVDDGKFRPDLFFRLDVIRISIPPLRQRKADILLLANHFLKVYCDEYDRKIDGFSDEAMAKLTGYDFPGNIRQLQNIVQEAVIETQSDCVGEDNIHLRKTPLMQDETSVQEDGSVSFKVGMSLRDIEKEVILKTLGAHDGNRTKTAEALDITSRTIRNKLREYRDEGQEA